MSKQIVTSRFSYFTASLQIFFSIITLYKVFFSGSILWIFIGMSLFLSILVITYDSRRVFYRLRKLPIKDKAIKFLLSVNGLLFTISSIYGISNILILVSRSDMSLALVPILISSIIFIGSSISIFSVNDIEL